MPLCVKATASEIEYFAKDSHANVIVTQPQYLPRLEGLRSAVPEAKIIVLDNEVKGSNTKQHFTMATPNSKDDSLVVYTSGTTGKPKGVMHTHGSVEASIKILVESWGWT